MVGGVTRLVTLDYMAPKVGGKWFKARPCLGRVQCCSCHWQPARAIPVVQLLRVTIRPTA